MYTKEVFRLLATLIGAKPGFLLLFLFAFLLHSLLSVDLFSLLTNDRIQPLVLLTFQFQCPPQASISLWTPEFIQ